MRAGPSQSEPRTPLQKRWAVAAVHGQACWGCGAVTSLDTAEIVPIVPAGDAEALAAFHLEPEFDVDGARNWALACPVCACSGAMGQHARKHLERAVRRGVMVRRAALEASYAPGSQPPSP